MRRLTTRDIAEMAGVSKTTVSFVLNGRTDMAIPENTRARVLEIARRLDYRPNPLAKALSTGRTHIIALWTQGMYEAYYAQAIRHFRERLKKSGFGTFIIETDEIIDGASSRDSSLWPADGIIAFESPKCTDAYVEANPGERKPIISTGAYWSDRTDFVGLDLYSGAREAVKHLLDLGHWRVAYLTLEQTIKAGDARHDAYAGLMRQAGLREEYISISPETPSDHRSCARSSIREYVKASGHPEAIFCFDDETAIGALRGLRDIGLRVPDDVALVGCDGIEETAYHEPPLSTIIMPVEQMCDLAWDFLQRRMEGASIPRQQAILKPSLAIRESSTMRSLR